MLTIPLPDAAATTALGIRLAPHLRAGDLVVLTGGLGAGKTTLTQGLGAALEVEGQVASPTFIIAREHPGPRVGLVHVDAYRLTSLAEVDQLDLDASLEDSVTVVEWGEGLVEDLAESRLEIALTRPRGDAADLVRTARIEAFGPRWAGEDWSDLAAPRPDVD
nr:tRNA (adenosine(37)-N6)-threonylcarbamoyltransferase complex ATPase subunit type 1 TsaE [Pseudactinotalea sp. HY160]